MKYFLKSILAVCLILINISVFAQHAHFIQKGTIEYEKRSNIYAVIKKRLGKNPDSYSEKFFEAYQKNNPQFKVAKSILTFNKNASLYTWPKTDETPSNNWFGKDNFVDLRNIVATNFDTQTSITQKTIYEETYLVSDSVRKIKWKITNETREIAGFECRRANAIIMDSVYVVAYYTAEIPISGGPEGFTGLPGLILGLALPHEHMTWFATKVTERDVQEKDLSPPKKGKPINNKNLNAILLNTMKNWGSEGKAQIKGFMF